MRPAIITLALMGSASALAQVPTGQTTVCAITLTNAHVFTGKAFEVRDLSMRDGRFAVANPALPRVDAEKLWLVPPFVDAHTHTIDTPTPKTREKHRHWLSQGVYYALNPNNVRPAGPTPVAREDEVEFQAAGGGLTRPGGHPTQLYPEPMDGSAYHLIRNPTEARAAVVRVKANGALMIDRATATAAAKAGIIVVPTAILSMAQFDGPALAEIQAVQRHNMALLRDAGVKMAVGEDFIGDFHDEVAALRSFGIFERAEMCRMATENGAELTFPGRRVGRLQPGYEASLLVYRSNPTNN